MKDYIFYDNIYTEEELKPFEDMYKFSSKWIDNYRSHGRMNRKVIYLDDSDIKFNINKMAEAYKSFLPDVIGKNFNRNLNSGFSIDAKIARYDAGGNFNWHVDESRIHKINPTWRRFLSTITYLNDDYEGGCTEFYDNNIIKPEYGKTLMFPSNWCFPHKGNIVEKGVKYILVIHLWI